MVKCCLFLFHQYLRTLCFYITHPLSLIFVFILKSYMDIFGKEGPSLVHTTCSKGVHVEPDPQNVFGKKGPTYNERMQIQKECLEFCYQYGATLDDMSAPFPDPAGISAYPRRAPNSKYQGHTPLGMTLINGHITASLYLLSIGASGRSNNLINDENTWIKCLLHERTKEEEKKLHDEFQYTMMNFTAGNHAEFNVQQMQHGMSQLRTLAQRYSAHKKRGTFSCPDGIRTKILNFACNIVESHEEYHTFLLCVRRAYNTKNNILEPLGRSAFSHIRQMIKRCLIIPGNSLLLLFVFDFFFNNFFLFHFSFSLFFFIFF
jgi:hypothetical protein